MVRSESGPAPWRAVLILAALLVVCGCGRTPHEGLRFGVPVMPVTLDPRFATDAVSVRINRLLYQHLVDFDASAMPRPELAEWKQISPTLYRFTLRAPRPGFSNGAPLTARDVKATYDYILDPRNASPHRLSLANIEAVAVDGEEVVEFHLRQPDLLFPGRLVLGILPAELIVSGHAFNREPVGSGPFELAAWASEGRLQLRRRDNGLGLEFIAVNDPTVRVLKLLRGEIDMLQNDLPPEMITYLKRQSGITVQEGGGTNFAYLGFNLQNSATGQPGVRAAIASALDRAAIVRYVLGGAAHPASAVLPPEHWAGNPGLAQVSYDPARARRLLREAGFGPEHPLRIVYKTSTDPFRLRLATIIQSQLDAVGVLVEIRSLDWGTFYGDIKAGNFQMYSLMWVGIKLPEIFRYAFHSSSIPPDGANRGRFASATVDRLIEQAEAAGTLEEQAVLYRAVQADLLEELPYVPLWYEDHVFVARNDIAGYQVSADGNYDGLVYVERRRPANIAAK
ncbi:MAG: ABC transporter substrate-binding protein [Gammaproteobacteria bacterium]|nr:ABC transporter substrate-binding protein [Gammaproteobacteria bacterium]